jgi:hypothetical protein
MTTQRPVGILTPDLHDDNAAEQSVLPETEPNAEPWRWQTHTKREETGISINRLAAGTLALLSAAYCLAAILYGPWWLSLFPAACFALLMGASFFWTR